jgi:hypothetical protein
MAKTEERTLSAQVLLRAASGRELKGDTAITAETLEHYLPSPEGARRARETLSQAGFETGPLVGNSFSITAPRATFEKFFRTRIRETEKGSWEFASSGGMELSGAALPKELAADVEAVTFTPPPDYGPTNF